MNPFLRIARPHKGHFLALEDLFLLIDQANPESQAPRRINARLANHTPTHKTPVSLTADLRHTFLYLTPNDDGSGRDGSPNGDGPEPDFAQLVTTINPKEPPMN